MHSNNGSVIHPPMPSVTKQYNSVLA